MKATPEQNKDISTETPPKMPAEVSSGTAQNEAALIENILQEMVAEFKQEAAASQQHILFEMMCDRLYWRIIYYMRRFPQRLTSGGASYSDQCIGREELRRYMGDTDESYSEDWLAANSVPPLEEAQNRVMFLDSQIRAFQSLEESDCAIAKIKRYFALNDIELEILATLVISMNEEPLHRMMMVAWADYSVRRPTITFMCNLLSDTPETYEAIYTAFDAERTLRRLRLVIVLEHALYPAFPPLAYCPVAVEQSVVDIFRGRKKSGGLPANMSLHTGGLLERQLVVDDAAYAELQYALKAPDARVILIGPEHSGRRTMLCSTARQHRHGSVLEVDASRAFERIPPQEAEQRMACIMREALLRGCVLLLRFDGVDAKPDVIQCIHDHKLQLRRLVQDYPGRIVLLLEHYHAILAEAFDSPLAIHIPSPGQEMSRVVWSRALQTCASQEASTHMAKVFSNNYSLPIGSIFAIVRDAIEAQQASGRSEPEIKSHHILNEIRKSFRHQLGSLAEITVSDIPLSGVVLPKDAKIQVDEILQYAKNLHNVLDIWGFRQRSPYGNALSVLFAGSPGTGKTLLACALANELGKVLYRVDLSRIVDKYIGETEKNLAKIFDEAAKAQAIILFDEADSLFAKRTEVKSSNDRYANLEINFLLQKLESYNGITILTTNLSKSIDEAFRRRLRFIIDFPMPDVPSRVELWKRMLPPNAPISNTIHWNWLARTFEMSGGYIRNAVLKAAISASAQGVPIGMKHLVKAASDEARSMGKLMRIDDIFDDEDTYDDNDIYDDNGDE